MKKVVKIVFVVGVIYLFNYKLGNSQSITFQKSYGGSLDQLGRSVVQTPDSGFITVGLGYSFLRTNKFGDTLFTKRSAATNIIRTTDDNYSIISFEGITKRDINSNIIWNRSPYNVNATIFKIKETFDKGFIVAGIHFGTTYTYPYILRIDSLGYLKWQKVYDTLFGGEATDIVQTIDGGYTFSGTYNDGPFIIKIDSNGSFLWKKNYSFILGAGANIASLVKLEMGYIFCSISAIIRVDENGNVIWYKIYNLGNNVTSLNSIIKTFEGGYAAAGERDTTASLKNVQSLFILKIDSSGNEQWNRLFGYVDSTNGGNVGNDIKQTFDSGFVVTGKTCGINFSCNANLFLVKTDKYGNSPIVNINNTSQHIPQYFFLYQNYPNPFNPVTTIKFSIPEKAKIEIIVYDLLGNQVKKILSDVLNPGEYSTNFYSENLSSGIYYCKLISQLKTKTLTDTKKMVLIK